MKRFDIIKELSYYSKDVCELIISYMFEYNKFNKVMDELEDRSEIGLFWIRSSDDILYKIRLENLRRYADRMTIKYSIYK